MSNNNYLKGKNEYEIAPTIKQNFNYKDTHILITLCDKVFNYSGIDINNIKYFVAGGSVFGTGYGCNYNDIDIYFHSEKDYQECIDSIKRKAEKLEKEQKEKYQAEHGDEIPTGFSSLIASGQIESLLLIIIIETDNALTFKYDDKVYQIIKFAYKDVKDAFKDFDISCSCCAITNDLELFQAKNFGIELHLNMKPHLDTLVRICKYETRGAIVCTEIFVDFIDIFIKDIYGSSVNESYYNDIKEVKNIVMLNRIISHNKMYLKLIHDKIVDMYKKNGTNYLFDIFTKIGWGQIDYDFDSLSVEYYTAKYFNFITTELGTFTSNISKWKDTPLYSPERDIESREKYPEYYI